MEKTISCPKCHGEIIVTAEYKSKNICGKCHGDLSFYNDSPELWNVKFIEFDDEGHLVVPSDLRVLCPKCGKKTMSFGAEILFD